MSGQMNLYNKKTENLKGTFGMIFQKSEETPAAKLKVQEALLWLKKNNVFYKNFLCNYERLERYALTNESYLGFPSTNSDVILKDRDRIELNINNTDDIGLIINVDERLF